MGRAGKLGSPAGKGIRPEEKDDNRKDHFIRRENFSNPCLFQSENIKNLLSMRQFVLLPNLWKHIIFLYISDNKAKWVKTNTSKNPGTRVSMA